VCPHELAQGVSLSGAGEIKLAECDACRTRSHEVALHQREMTLGWASVWDIADEVKLTVPSFEDPKYQGPVGFLGEAYYRDLAGWQDAQTAELGDFVTPGNAKCGPKPNPSDAAWNNLWGFKSKEYNENLVAWFNCMGPDAGGGGQASTAAPAAPAARGGRARGGRDAMRAIHERGQMVEQQKKQLASQSQAAGRARQQAAKAKAALAALKSHTDLQVQKLRDQVKLTSAAGDKRVLQQKIADLEKQQGALGTLSSQMVSMPMNPAVIALQAQLASRVDMGPQAVIASFAPQLPMLVQQMPSAPGGAVQTFSTLMAPSVPVPAAETVTTTVTPATPGTPETITTTVTPSAPSMPVMAPSQAIDTSALAEQIKEQVEADIAEEQAASGGDDGSGDDFDFEGVDYEGVVDPEFNESLGLGGIDNLMVGDAIESFASGALGWSPEELAQKLAETESEAACLTGCNTRL
jgi:hypothetical protein